MKSKKPLFRTILIALTSFFAVRQKTDRWIFDRKDISSVLSAEVGKLNKITRFTRDVCSEVEADKRPVKARNLADEGGSFDAFISTQ